jgi:hypothetical protein
MKTVWLVLCIIAFVAIIATVFYVDRDPGRCIHLSYLPC